ncbi:MAG TPA: MBL fold metallo-hydrolase [Pyrinomonadaceae bacterium]|nr:MBL fold metallo-hydrolase [Pyrinomonadaceae bacterium]
MREVPPGTNGMVDAPQFHTAIHMLDVGADPYGDAVLCQFGSTTVLIDGGHPGSFNGQGTHDSIPAQLEDLLQHEPPFEIDLVIISHAHQDHIGCIPRMVKEGVLRPKWALLIDPALGWGRINIDEMDVSTRAYPDKVRQVAFAMREHPRLRPEERINMADFLLDGVTLEERYETMIQTLKENGTKVVRFGRDSTTAITNAFENIGFTILGPTKAHLRACAKLIARSTQDALDRAADFFQLDAGIDLETAYVKLLSSSLDSLDAASRLGAAVNLQSIVTMFDYRNRKHLFAGDMQFEDPEVSTPSINNSVRALREIVSENAPFDSVKISHHGSHNAFSQEIFDEMGGTVLYGICAGEKSTSHPSRDTLSVLKENRNDIKWVRTDRNRRSSFFFGSSATDIDVSEGNVNDFRPNSTDEAVAPTLPKAPEKVMQGQPATKVATPPIEQVDGADTVELIMRIPRKSTVVTFSGQFSIEVKPGTTDVTTSRPPEESRTQRVKSSPSSAGSSNRLAGLLLVTNRERLASNIGQQECEQILEEVSQAGAKVFDGIPDNINEAAKSFEEVLRQQSGFKGVVLLGGYDVVPSQRFDCLPPDVRARVDTEEDPDNFIVWSDDVYGKRDDQGMPDIPVSRIPDGQSAHLVSTAIKASPPHYRSRGGVRNSARPFAEQIWANLGGREELLISEPTVPDGIGKEHFRVDQIYLMLHGHHNDTARFWGEAGADYVEAFNVANIPALEGSVVFTGCCWGALTVNKIASRYSPDQPIAQKTPGSSIALRFLENGANAFVGCTGAHYSPNVEPYSFFGGPMHAAFWRKLLAGEPPAQALLNAKEDYLKEMPHGRRGLGARAIEFKILWQYTCLGLGW